MKLFRRIWFYTTASMKSSNLNSRKSMTSLRELSHTHSKGNNRKLGDIAAISCIFIIFSIANHSYIENAWEPNSEQSKIKHLSSNFIADAVDIALPSVVNIVCNVSSIMTSGSSTGSGFIVSQDGFIVTNAHVVSSAIDGKVVVTMSDLTKRMGYVHSLDKKTDIALVKLYDTSNLHAAKLGHSSKLRVGEFVVALGSPLFLQNTVTFGIVSALSRHGTELGMSKSRNEFIQTDAAINSGNSGGPLVNINGEVVGINVLKAQGVDGISFAIPIDAARQIIKQLKTNKSVTRPHLGIRISSFVTKSNGSSIPQVFIQEIETDSPAYDSGLRSGDVVLEIDRKPVKSAYDVLDAIGYEVGKIVEFKVRKSDGSETSHKVKTTPEK